jgi:hypothetical protein
MVLKMNYNRMSINCAKYWAPAKNVAEMTNKIDTCIKMNKKDFPPEKNNYIPTRIRTRVARTEAIGGNH